MPIAPTLDIRTATNRDSHTPAVGTWRFPRDPGLTVGGASRITLTNMSSSAMRVRIGEDLGADLPARGLLTLNLRPELGNQTLLFETVGGGEAEGFFILHDTISDWRIPGVGAEAQTPFQGPIGLALVNHPSSGLVVEWIADGGVKDRVAPGEVASRPFTDEEARTMSLLGMGNVTGEGSAKGVFCGLDTEQKR